MGELFFKLLLLLSSTLVAFISTDYLFGFIKSDDAPQRVIIRPLYPIQNSEIFGYELIPGIVHRATLNRTDRDGCYDVTYHINQYGRRFMSDTHQKDGMRKLILMGDSLMFGEGLNDHDTLDSRLSQNFLTENWAVPGYGPQHALLKLMQSKVGDSYNNSSYASATFIYLFIGEHFDRALGSCATPWLFNGPSAKGILKGDYQKLGDSLGWKEAVCRSLDRIGVYSNIAKAITPGFVRWELSEQVRVVVELFSKMSSLTKELYSGKLKVVVHPMSPVGELRSAFLKELSAQGVEFVDLAEIGFDDSDMINPHCDRHQNAKFNNRLAEILLDHL